MIDIKDLEAFLAILDGGSISKAAEDLGLTQPALSLKLKKMETDLGLKLFHRTSRNVVPLDTARAMEAKVRDILSRVDSLHESLAESTQDLKGTVRVGSLMGWFEALMIPTVSVIQQKAPQLRLRFHFAETAQLIPMVAHGQIDVAIIAQPFALIEGVTSEHLLDEELVLVGKDLPKNPSEAARKKALLQRPWLTMQVPDPLVETYWKEQFGTSFPWNEANVPVTLDNILALPRIVRSVPDAIAVLPKQIVTPELLKETGLQIAEAVPQPNGVFLIWRTDALELKRFKITKDSIAESARLYRTKHR